MKTEVDYDPIQDYDGSQDPGEAELDVARAIPDSPSEDGQEADQKESGQEDALERFETVKSALQSHLKRVNDTSASANLREEGDQVSATPIPPVGGGSPIKEKIVAFLALTHKS